MPYGRTYHWFSKTTANCPSVRGNVCVCVWWFAMSIFHCNWINIIGMYKYITVLSLNDLVWLLVCLQHMTVKILLNLLAVLGFRSAARVILTLHIPIITHVWQIMTIKGPSNEKKISKFFFNHLKHQIKSNKQNKKIKKKYLTYHETPDHCQFYDFNHRFHGCCASFLSLPAMYLFICNVQTHTKQFFFSKTKHKTHK